MNLTFSVTRDILYLFYEFRVMLMFFSFNSQNA